MSETQTREGASAEAIRHHYDLSNDFYGLWLDRSLTYSCALWDGDDDTLEQAQLRKLDYLTDQARAAGTERVLDVGCGWGSLMRRLVDHHEVAHVVGLTLSDAQAGFIAAQDDPRLEVLREGWADHEPDEPYDAILSIGAMEHFVRFGLPRAQRVAVYREFFDRCHRWLRPGGWMGLQAIGKGNRPLDEETAADLLFLTQTIFPESDSPRLAEVAHAAEKRFEVVRVRNDRPHYARTCTEWAKRLAANRDAAVELVGEQAVDVYERYLRVAVRQFERNQTVLYRFTLQRV
jgi:cyclopropane-fatty-acyl-phospholipid synthase